MTTPNRIKKLSSVVINRIAAGEIIQRPCNAIKEMVENSIDAGSTSISITTKDGGLKLIRIEDNGCGICKEDLGLVCERFATSKLRIYADLESIETHGFRGEALVTTKTKESPFAWKAFYSDGKLVPGKKGGSEEPKPCAGNNGTQILVEDLFYNVDNRRKALKNVNDEYQKILDVLQRYAVHNAGISFTCKKQGSTNVDLQTQNTFQKTECIKHIYGQQISKELLQFTYKEDLQNSAVGLKKSQGFITNANFSNSKKFIFLLFINDRLVESSTLKKAIENLYQDYLPKGGHPFVYLSLVIKKENVDVNVHPTKREVHFLNEDKITELIIDGFKNCLADANSSRNFKVQTILPFSQSITTDHTFKLTSIEPTTSQSKSSHTPTKTPVNKVVRVDPKMQTLDSFLIPTEPLVLDNVISPKVNQSVNNSEEVSNLSPSLKRKINETKEISPVKNQVQNISEELERTSKNRPAEELDLLEAEMMELDDFELEESILRNKESAKANVKNVVTILDSEDERDDKFNGIIKNDREYIDVQLTSVLELRQEVLYKINRQDEDDNSTSTTKKNGISIREILNIALDEEDEDELNNAARPKQEYDGGSQDENGSQPMSRTQIIEYIESIFKDNKEMLNEYFSITVNDEGYLETLPLVLKGYEPNFNKLPSFLLRMGSQVDWTSEKKCFDTICRELALLYTFEYDGDVEMEETRENGNLVEEENFFKDPKEKKYKNFIEFKFFNKALKVKNNFFATKDLLDSECCLNVCDLSDIYKVFERC
ncbi:DNA mismatch repair protein [Clydaea vesicula]|uniref:DNA mismatch repair protein n=1 Tax=Clydaea vesicula TaxID=447962 RepID=A0AAD5U430_9FUNG|nr:DNA mismatch repair protein [Clydaea vesicula]